MFIKLLGLWCARQELNLHPLGLEPKSSASASSATGAFYKNQVEKPDIYEPSLESVG